MQNKTLQMKRALRTALLVLLLSVAGMGKGYASFNFSAVCSTGQTLYFSITDATNHYVKVTYPGSSSDQPYAGYGSPHGDLVIPETVVNNNTTYTVTSIGYRAFWACYHLSSIIIPNSVTSIGDYAFNGCHGIRTSIEIPNSVISIGSYAFRNCLSLTSVTIGNSVTSIGSYAFKGCRDLLWVAIPNSVNSIGIDAFYETGWYNAQGDGILYLDGWCLGYKGAKPTGVLILAENTRGIADEAFSNCNGLTDALVIPDSVTSIGYNAFSSCSGLSSVTIGNSVTNVGSQAFNDCSGLTCVYYTGDVEQWCGISFFSYSSNPIFYAHNWFINNVQVTDLTIPNSVTSIGNYAFLGCSSMTALNIPNSVTSIGDFAFASCSAITGAIVIPNSVTSIGSYAFTGCSGLTGALVIPDSVTSIGFRSFAFCSGLTSVTIGKSMTHIDDHVFFGCSLSTINYYVDDCQYMGTEAFIDCQVTTLNIGDNVTSIPVDAFSGCATLNTIIVYRATPPQLGTLAFSNISPIANLFVPCGSQMAYFSNWNIFDYNNIHEDCSSRPVSVNSNITGGNVTTSVAQATMGQEVFVTVTPNTGMQLASLHAYNTNDPSQLIPLFTVGKAKNSSYRFVMPPFAVTISAIFENYDVLFEDYFSVYASVYPNPTDGYVKIESESLKRLTISNMHGQQIFNGSADGDAFEYDFGQHGAGVYLVRIETSEGVATKRVVVTQ